MCRIAGVINPRFSNTLLMEWTNTMCDRLVHGGPDSGGTYSVNEQHLVLGNRRLALQDLSKAGEQPMHYANRYSITYNGELYNFPVLKQELISLGYSFTNHTDTEVILAAFAQWNTQAFARFSGMFAFALWDNLKKELYIVRDPAGIKPLYYSLENGGLAFASEIKALKAIPYLQEENSHWPVYLLAYGHIPEPVTTIKNVLPLHKGCFIKYNASNCTYSYQSFAHFTYTREIQDKETIIRDVQQIIYDSVERHLIADAPIGVFLSGGLDSSVIARVAANVGKSTLNTFSLYFTEAAYSEKKYQDLLLNDLKCNAYQHLLTESEFHDSFKEILNDMDMPGCDGINTWFISKYAREKGLKAVLSGIGGDELFGGYPSFTRMSLASRLQKIPVQALSNFGSAGLKQLDRLSFLQLQGIKGIYLFLRGHFSPYQIAKQLNASEKEVWEILKMQPVLGDVDVLKPGNKASWMEFNLYMQNQLLRDADVMSMAHGVEIRVPMLDNELVRYVQSIYPSLKFSGSYKKQLLIDAFRSQLPEAIWNRPKMGFSFPFSNWLQNSQYLRDMVSNADSSTQKNYNRFMNGKLHWSQMLSLLLLQTSKMSH
ncbi:MAG: asparagine synthase (glutamine-hydrolyzing) [Ferruginibacter sp.]|nr:asparagine synthase (glutamine-hydrolyzing) [Ferruginibacter sp.]